MCDASCVYAVASDVGSSQLVDETRGSVVDEANRTSDTVASAELQAVTLSVLVGPFVISPAVSDALAVVEVACSGLEVLGMRAVIVGSWFSKSPTMAARSRRIMEVAVTYAAANSVNKKACCFMASWRSWKQYSFSHFLRFTIVTSRVYPVD